MAWVALQQSVMAGSADAQTVAAKCMEGRGSDYEREQALVKLYIANELPEDVRALVAPFMQSPSEAVGGDISVGQAEEPAAFSGGAPATQPAVPTESSPYSTPRHISPEERVLMYQGMIEHAELESPNAKAPRPATETSHGSQDNAGGTAHASVHAGGSTCCICQETILPGAEGQCGACMVKMHAACLVATTADRPSCPACRADLRGCGYLVGGRTIRPVTAAVVPPPPPARQKGHGKGKQAPQPAAEYEIVESPPIQIANAERLAHMQFGRRKIWGGMDALTLVHYIKLRASRKRDEEGHVIHTTDYYRLSDLSRGLAMETRLYSGFLPEKDSSDLPTTIAAERAKGVPDCLLGRSVLQLPKICRFLFFVDSPTVVLEHDLMVAHLRAALAEATAHSIPCQELQEYVQSPDSIEATRASIAVQTGAERLCT